MSNINLRQNEKGLGKPVLILIIVLSVLVVGGAGYLIGQNMAESDAEKRVQEQVSSLQQQLDDAKAQLSGDIAEGQEAVAEGQQTLESLQAENTQLKATIEEQKTKIADLEKQLEEAESIDPPPQN